MAHLHAVLMVLSSLGASPNMATRAAGAFQAGVASSPVELTLYVSVASDAQRELVASLYREVEVGRLKGRVRLAVRPVLTDEADERVVRAIHAAAVPRHALALSAAPVRGPETALRS